MVYKIEPKKKRKLLGIYKTKIHGKGFVVIPADVRQALGLVSGKELSVEVRGKEIILRPVEFKFREGAIDENTLNAKTQDAWILRGAYREAEEFFKELSETLHLLYGREFEYGYDEGLNKVYLKLGEGNLQETIHFSYFEDYYFSSGVITLDFGRGTEAERILKEFVEGILEKEKLNKKTSLKINLKKIGRVDRGIGIKVFEHPYFDKKEFGILVYLASKVIENDIIHQRYQNTVSTY